MTGSWLARLNKRFEDWTDTFPEHHPLLGLALFGLVGVTLVTIVFGGLALAIAALLGGSAKVARGLFGSELYEAFQDGFWEALAFLFGFWVVLVGYRTAKEAMGKSTKPVVTVLERCGIAFVGGLFAGSLLYAGDLENHADTEFDSKGWIRTSTAFILALAAAVGVGLFHGWKRSRALRKAISREEARRIAREYARARLPGTEIPEDAMVRDDEDGLVRFDISVSGDNLNWYVYATKSWGFPVIAVSKTTAKVLLVLWP